MLDSLPDASSLRPIPLLEPDENRAGPPAPEEPMVRYDVRTGEEVVIELPDEIKQQLLTYKPRASAGNTTISELEAGRGVQTLNMSALEKVPYPKDYPACVSVLLTTSQGRGSGVLIDPYFVLTAGHCIHEGDGGNWAEDVMVYPGFDSQDRKSPYGYAEYAALYSWPGWMQDSSEQHDLGLVELKRPVGALTGYHSYSHEAACSFYTGNSFYIPGYPADGPYKDNLDMYYFHGSFGGCPTLFPNIVTFFRQSYGGQSGSGVCYTDGSGYTVYAVLTGGISLINHTRCTRVTSSKFADIVNWIGNRTPFIFDLVALNLRINPTSIDAGSQLSSLDYLVHNYGSMTWSGTVDVQVYLSGDPNITTDDTLIQRHSFSTTLHPKANVRVNVPTVVLP